MWIFVTFSITYLVRILDHNGLFGLYFTDLPCPILTMVPSLINPLSIDTVSDLLRPSSCSISLRVNSPLHSRNVAMSLFSFPFFAGRVMVKDDPPVSMVGFTGNPSYEPKIRGIPVP